MSASINSYLGCLAGLVIFFAVLLLLAWLPAYLTSQRAEKITDYQQAKEQIISALQKSVEAQSAGRLDRIDDGYDGLDLALPRNAGPEFDKLLQALYFWDCWIDACNHGWRQYEGMQAEDWPRIARFLIDDLQADQEIAHHLKRIS